MQDNVDAIIADLSIRLFSISPEQVEEAVTASRSGQDRSLVEEIASRGALRDHERGVLDSLYAQLLRHDAQTKSAYPPAFLPGRHSQAPDRMEDVPAADSSGELGEGERYEVRDEHAQGGMGRILKVWDRRMQREVALKEIRPGGEDFADSANRKRVLARFLQEARITGRLQHPSIIPVHEIGERADGTLYYTMKFVRGRTLHQAISTAESLEERMVLLPHYLNLCQAVAYAHAHGVIHRDLKPSNVMIGEFGETLVIDWGLAKELGRREVGGEASRTAGDVPPCSFDLTMDGQLLGTPHYMAPEQVAGKHDELDERADVYALGAVLYELLTGSRPYRASSGLEVLRKAATEQPTPPDALCPDAPPALVAICGRAMAREPGARYLSAGRLAEEITRFQAGARVEAHQYGLTELLAAFIKRHQPVVATAGLLLVVLAGVVLYAFLSLRTRHAVEHELRVAAEREQYDYSIALAERGIEETQYAQVEEILARAPNTYRSWDWGRLAYVANSLRKPIARARGLVWNAAVSPSGDRVVCVGPEGIVEALDLKTGERLGEFSVPTSEVRALAFHPLEHEFACSTEEGILQRWSLESGDLLATYDVPDGPAVFLAYSPDGLALAGGRDGGITLWDLKNERMNQTYNEPGSIVNAIAFSPNGQWLAAGDSDGKLFVWNRISGGAPTVTVAHTDNRQTGIQGVQCLAFSPDSAFIATGGCDAQARIWRPGELRPLHTLSGHLKRVYTLAFTADSRSLFTDSQGNVKRWDVGTGKEMPCWIRTPTVSRHLYFPPGTNTLITANGSGLITRWTLDASTDGAYLAAHTEEVNAVRFTPDGRYLLSAAGHWKTGGDERVLVWDMGTHGQSVPEEPLRILEGGRRWIRPMALHPDGRRVCAGDGKGRLLVWDWHTGDLASVLNVPEYIHGMRCLAIHPDGRRVVTAGWADAKLPDVTEWDLDTGQRTGTFTGESDTIDAIAYSPDGALLAAGTRDGVAVIWNVATRTRLHALTSDLGWVYGLAFSPDGKTLATAHGQMPIRLWDVASGTLLHQMEGLHDRGNSIVFSPDGTRVASGDMRITKIWSTVTGAPLLTLPHGAHDIAFSPDGRTLATAGVDGRIGLWHSESWK